MNDREVDERVAKIRACSHSRCHYRDANGNRCCWECEAFVRDIPGVRIVAVRKEVDR